MFAITARARVVRVVDLPTSGFRKKARFTVFGERENILESDIFSAVAGIYNVSPNPKDYLFIVVRAVTADTANSNGDLFPSTELRRFDPSRNCQVYQTFQNVPFHLNHQAADRTQARGFLPDVHFNSENEDDQYVETLVAIDRTKDAQLASDYESGRRNSCSMGCLAAKVQCSICQKMATNEDELCHHLRSQKMQRIGGSLCYETCYGVTYTELSDVPDPADKKALTIAMLGRIAARRILPLQKTASAGSTPLLDTLDLEPSDRKEIVRFFGHNLEHLPDGLVRLGMALMESRV